MKTKTIRFVSCLLISGGLTGVAFADGATVVRGEYCPVIDANGVLYYPADNKIQFVFTPSGNYSINCNARLPDGAALPDKTIHWDFDSFGVSCYSFGDRWTMTVTPSGQSSLSCHGKL